MNEKLSELYRKFDEYKAMNLSLNMARGKPGKEQLDISNDILDPALLGNYKSADGTEVRNYGVLDGTAKFSEFPKRILLFSETRALP